jgi:threonine dehydrogenase-like Zn-dependent dehydrogenase
VPAVLQADMIRPWRQNRAWSRPASTLPFLATKITQGAQQRCALSPELPLDVDRWTRCVRDSMRRLKDMFDGIGPDVVVECVGTKESIDTPLQAVRLGGKIGFVGVPEGGLSSRFS